MPSPATPAAPRSTCARPKPLPRPAPFPRATARPLPPDCRSRAPTRRRARRLRPNKIEHPSGSVGSIDSPRTRMIAPRAASRLNRSSHDRESHASGASRRLRRSRPASARWGRTWLAPATGLAAFVSPPRWRCTGWRASSVGGDDSQCNILPGHSPPSKADSLSLINDRTLCRRQLQSLDCGPGFIRQIEPAKFAFNVAASILGRGQIDHNTAHAHAPSGFSPGGQRVSWSPLRSGDPGRGTVRGWQRGGAEGAARTPAESGLAPARAAAGPANRMCVLPVCWPNGQATPALADSMGLIVKMPWVPRRKWRGSRGSHGVFPDR